MTSPLDKLVISPPVCPGKQLDVQPGDLRQFAPYGNGVYGYEKKDILSPIRGDPPQEESGGIVYFGNSIKKKDFRTFLKMMNIRLEDTDYAAFFAESSQPEKDRYFKQMRLISRFGLRFMFGALNNQEYDSFKNQPLSVDDALVNFMESEKQRWGTNFWNSKMDGKCGGNGDSAREQLSFGFMLENQYHQIYRIWSRAWLVTK